MFTTRREAVTGLLAGALLSISLATMPTASYAADSTVAEGSNFTVTQVAGGYEVSLALDSALPVLDDAPTIIVDGVEIGIATESTDGRTLTVITSDPEVADADRVTAGWASRSDSADPSSARSTQRTADLESLAAEDPAEPLDEDPTSLGSYEFTEGEYNFGAQSIPLANIGGVRGELQGKVYLPKTGGERPTVILMHGRHSSCYAAGSSSASLVWPCSGSRPLSIPSYLGYEGTGRALASHGYSVVSISVNAINANDNQLALDQGAGARGQVVLDTLAMLKKANAGQDVSYDDAQTARDVSLAEALTDGMAPADLVGHFDLDDVGLMGHSRGGEGVTAAATLNNALAHPFGIKAVLPLAPVDFGRMTIPNVPMQVILPYCDGDVSNQQGQHMLDDSRYAFGDDALRTGTWVMGANHNFFNTVWTPGKFIAGTADDFGATSTNQTCGPVASVSATSLRLSADKQYEVGVAYMAGYFRMALGGEKQFLPMFDGSGSVPAVLGLDGSAIRSVTTAPASARATVTSFETTSSLVRNYGAATVTPCASLFGRTIPVELPACSTTLASAQVPHWTPASNGGNVPATPLNRMVWTAAGGEVRVTVPKAARDASTFDRLSVKLAADESVIVGTDLTLSVKDGSGHTYSSLVSALNPYALVRLPTPSNATTTTLKKIVLQQVNVPTSDIAAAGVAVDDIREVRFTAAVGADAVTTGAAYLSDLAFESSSVGTPAVATENTVNVSTSTVDEGNGPGSADVAVYLDEPATSKVTGYVSILGSTTGRGGIAMEKVTFAAGEKCKVVTGSLLGDTLPSTTASTAVKVSVVNTSGAVMGAKAFANLTVREDDGQTNSVTPLPPAGAQGDACDELAALSSTGTITADDDKPAPGATVVLTASGYRPGEGVTFSMATTAMGVAVADAAGTAVYTGVVPTTAPTGVTALKAVGAGTGYTSEGSISVLTETETTLSMTPEIPAINESATLTAQVTGDDTEGSVEFFDGDISLGVAPVDAGTAALEVGGGFKSGTHQLTAVFGETASAQTSTSNVVTLTLTKGQSGIALVLAADSSVYGSGGTGSVAVANGDHGTVTVSFGDMSFDVTLGDEDSGTFTLPTDLAAGTYEVDAVFNGTDKYDPSGVATAAYTVTKKSTSAAVSSSSSVKAGKTLTVKTTVKGATAGTYPTGTVKIYVQSGSKYYLKKTVTLASSSKGVVSTGVTMSKSKKTIRVKAIYSGSANYAGSSSPSKAVKVK